MKDDREKKESEELKLKVLPIPEIQEIQEPDGEQLEALEEEFFHTDSSDKIPFFKGTKQPQKLNNFPDKNTDTSSRMIEVIFKRKVTLEEVSHMSVSVNKFNGGISIPFSYIADSAKFLLRNIGRSSNNLFNTKAKTTALLLKTNFPKIVKEVKIQQLEKNGKFVTILI